MNGNVMNGNVMDGDVKDGDVKDGDAANAVSSRCSITAYKKDNKANKQI